MNFGNKKPIWVLAYAFLTGFCVVGMEIAASRLLAPYYGTSIFVWSNIIAVVLLCLAIGYHFGGKISEKHPDLSWLTGLTFAGGILFLFIPLLSAPLITFIEGFVYGRNPSSFSFFASNFIAAVVLFGVPIVFLAMTTPLMVKLYDSSTNKAGESAGRVFAVSTVGSILGTIVPTLWMLPDLGTRATVYVFAGILVFLGLAGRLKAKFVVIVAASAIVSLAKPSLPPSQNFNVLYEGESAYHHIKVVEDLSLNRYLLFNEGVGVESIYNHDKILTGAFYDYFNLLPYLVKEDGAKEALVLGLAGGTMPRQLNYFFGDEVKVDAVEIDPKVIYLAKQYFDLDKLKLDVYNEDGRKFLEDTGKQYDLVMIDVFQNELYIPWTMTTKEFWQLVEHRLDPGGLVAINVHASSNDSKLLKAISNTQASVFSNVYLVDYKNGKGFSYMIIAANRNLAFGFSGVNLPTELAALVTDMGHSRLVAHDPNQLLLTDDRAPIEQLSEHSIGFYRRQKLIK